MKNKYGQVWLETVLYTLVGLVLIGIVLTFITPKIKEKQDQITVQQALESLRSIDERVRIEPGNTREIFVTSKRGQLEIKSIDNEIAFYFDDLSKAYSELDSAIRWDDRTRLLSKKLQKGYSLTAWIEYGQAYNITYNGNKEDKIFTSATTAYRLQISNLGDLNGDGKYEIKIRESSGS